jgi:hypothetical protein
VGLWAVSEERLAPYAHPDRWTAWITLGLGIDPSEL